MTMSHPLKIAADAALLSSRIKICQAGRTPDQHASTCSNVLWNNVCGHILSFHNLRSFMIFFTRRLKIYGYGNEDQTLVTINLPSNKEDGNWDISVQNNRNIIVGLECLFFNHNYQDLIGQKRNSRWASSNCHLKARTYWKLEIVWKLRLARSKSQRVELTHLYNIVPTHTKSILLFVKIYKTNTVFVRLLYAALGPDRANVCHIKRYQTSHVTQLLKMIKNISAIRPLGLYSRSLDKQIVSEKQFDFT